MGVLAEDWLPMRAKGLRRLVVVRDNHALFAQDRTQLHPWLSPAPAVGPPPKPRQAPRALTVSEFRLSDRARFAENRRKRLRPSELGDLVVKPTIMLRQLPVKVRPHELRNVVQQPPSASIKPIAQKTQRTKTTPQKCPAANRAAKKAVSETAKAWNGSDSTGAAGTSSAT